MPLKQTQHGGECPLSKFEIGVCGGAGAYTKDPVEECLLCNFGDTGQEEFDLEKICQCPSDMTWGEYNRLREGYASTGEGLTKKGFWEFVEKNYVH